MRRTRAAVLALLVPLAWPARLPRAGRTAPDLLWLQRSGAPSAGAAPAAGQHVLAIGATASDDGRTAVFRARAVRDVLVASGAFRLARATASTVPVEVGVSPGLPDNPAAVTVVVPDLGGGVEQPAALLLGSGQGSPSDATGATPGE